MKLSYKQAGVIKGMLLAMICSLVVIFTAINLDPLGYANSNHTSGRLAILGFSLLLPTLTLIISIARLAQFRFVSVEDIDSSGLTPGTSQARLLQSLLQNTLEQLVIALAVYTACCLLMPATWLSAVPLSSILFTIGRIFFFKGYSRGAQGRAFGFALTFYPTVIMLLLLLAYQSTVLL